MPPPSTASLGSAADMKIDGRLWSLHAGGAPGSFTSPSARRPPAYVMYVGGAYDHNLHLPILGDADEAEVRSATDVDCFFLPRDHAVVTYRGGRIGNGDPKSPSPLPLGWRGGCIGKRGRRRRGAPATAKMMYGDLPAEHSCEDALGVPMEQTVPGSCALVSCTLCVEAVHRMEYEAIHGRGTFPCRAAAPRKLRRECIRERYWYAPEEKMESVWDPRKGCRCIEKMLDILIRMGGAPTTNAPTPSPRFLPLQAWEGYYWHDGSLTPEVAARLLHERGPCVGVIFCTEEYDAVDASMDAESVYRGCHRWEREDLLERLKDKVGYHAVLCFAYRHRKGELQVVILDSLAALGPMRWVAFDQFDEWFTIRVNPLISCPPATKLYYPMSRCYT